MWCTKTSWRFIPYSWFFHCKVYFGHPAFVVKRVRSSIVKTEAWVGSVFRLSFLEEFEKMESTSYQYPLENHFQYRVKSSKIRLKRTREKINHLLEEERGSIFCELFLAHFRFTSVRMILPSLYAPMTRNSIINFSVKHWKAIGN